MGEPWQHQDPILRSTMSTLNVQPTEPVERGPRYEIGSKTVSEILTEQQDAMARDRGSVLTYHKVMELIFIVSLTFMRASKGQIQSHIGVALDLGVTSEEILEAIEISLPEAGVVAFQEGFAASQEVVGANGTEPTVDVFDASR